MCSFPKLKMRIFTYLLPPQTFSDAILVHNDISFRKPYDTTESVRNSTKLNYKNPILLSLQFTEESSLTKLMDERAVKQLDRWRNDSHPAEDSRLVGNKKSWTGSKFRDNVLGNMKLWFLTLIDVHSKHMCFLHIFNEKKSDTAHCENFCKTVTFM